MNKIKQEQFWQGEFGKEYTDRNSFSNQEWDRMCIETWGKTKLEINTLTIGDLPKDIKILEVGCNIGIQLNGLQSMGFTNLYGIELQPYATEQAKKFTKNINIICGSGFDLPFKDNYFDLVCTTGVLIHISPTNLPKIMREMYRCTKKYISGFEYFAEQVTEINYRGYVDYLWKADFSALFMKEFPDLKQIRKDMYPYLDGSSNVDCQYFLEKSALS
jgi:pseudaminic acid biosynthesis-associated methylase